MSELTISAVGCDVAGHPTAYVHTHVIDTDDPYDWQLRCDFVPEQAVLFFAPSYPFPSFPAEQLRRLERFAARGHA